MFRIALQTLGGRTPTWSSCRRRQRLLSRFPDCGVRLNAHCILQSELGELSAELCSLPIPRIRQYHAHRSPLLHGLSNLLQGNLRFGLKPNFFRNARSSAGFGILAPPFRQI